MAPFDKVDEVKIKKDNNYFKGVVVSRLDHIHECFHRIENKVISLENEIKGFNLTKAAIVGGLSGILATVAPELLKIIK